MKINVQPKLLFAIISFSIVGIMAVLNYLTPLLADDYAYATSTSLFDAISQEIVQYHNWSGRSVAHLIARIVLMFRPYVFDIINAVMALLLFILTALHINPNKHKLNFYILLSFIIFFIITPDFGQVFFWTTGSSNYLWTMVLMLIFLLPYRLELALKIPALNSTRTFLFSSAMLLLGIVAGWCNESTSGGVVLLVIGALIYNIATKRKISAWMICGLIGAMFGLFMMISAPGNFVRGGDFSVFGMSVYILQLRTSTFFSLFYAHYLLPTIAIILSVIISTKSIKDKLIPIYILLVSYAVVGVLTVAPGGLGGRGIFGSIAFLVIALGAAFNLLEENKFFKLMESAALSILSLFFIPLLFNASIDILNTYEEYIFRKTYINSQLANGNTNIIVGDLSTPLTTHNALHSLDDIGDRNAEYINAYFREQNNIDSILSIPYGEWVKSYSYGVSEYIGVNSISEYANLLANSPYLITVTLNNPTRQSLPREILGFAEQIGLSNLAENPDLYSYAAAIYNGEVTELAHDGTTNLILDQPANINLLSLFAGANSYSTVFINGNDYTINKTGLNIIVYNVETGTAIDMLSFNLYQPDTANRALGMP